MSLFLTDIPYSLEALFAAGRIFFWFILLFGIMAPLVLPHTRNLPVIEKMIYSWVGLGGIITVAVMVLTTLHIYDFLSISLTLLLIPLIVKIWNSDFSNLHDYMRYVERKMVLRHIRMIEGKTSEVWNTFRQKLRSVFAFNWIKNDEVIIVISIALVGSITRMYPALMNAAPFSRSWFSQLNRVKNLQVQDYFSGYPEPGGMHSLVSLFSMLTQVSPEMILHLLGALSSFFLCILIYWMGRDLIPKRYRIAPILGLSFYALVPMMFIPISLDQQVEASSIDIALCFALPTIIILIRNIRQKSSCPWFYVWLGFTATAMTNLFVCFVILLPVMVMALLFIPNKKRGQKTWRIGVKLLLIAIAVAVPYVTGVIYYEINFQSFLRDQLYSIQVFSYYPLLIKPIEELSIIYLSLTGLMIAYLIYSRRKEDRIIRDKLIFLIIFGLLSLAYTPLFDHIQFFSTAIDQFNALYAVLIAIFASILFMIILEWTYRILNPSQKTFRFFSWSMLLVLVFSLIFVQGGLKVSRLYPFTMPNGFFEAYYKIIDERVPYSYATVGPEINRITAKNRHFFMDYRFFLNEYKTLDSLYHRQLAFPDEGDTPEEIPPASIFIFTENPPYGSIQQGILYNSAVMMSHLNNWIREYENQREGAVSVFYSDPNTTVYEITNREDESKIQSILNRTK